MRKTLLLTLALLLSATLFAQNRATLINETFEGTSLPNGWRVIGKGTTNWSVAKTDKAGGKPNELDLFWDPGFDGISRMTMTPLDLSDISSIVISFKHYLDYYPYYDGICSIGVATSSDNGLTWNTGWSKSYNETKKYVVNEIITTPDMGKQNVLVCIYYEGNTDNINSWQFDDILVFSQEENDAEIQSIDMPDKIGNGNNNISFSVRNLGTATIETFEASFQIDNRDVFVSESFNTNIAPFETKQFTFEKENFFSIGDYTLNIEITSVNGTDDNFTDNNTINKDITVGMGTCQRIPMIEHFSSSTCFPCVFTNEHMDTLTRDNAGKYTYVKYPMNGPGTGDPYYFSDCNTRRSYYNVNNVPTIFLDGNKADDPMPYEKLEKNYNTKSFFNIRGSFNIDGNTINIITDIMSYIDVKNSKIYVTVNEKTTTENIGTNGETEFHHILMKMMQSANGISLDMKAGKHQRLDFSFDMSSTNVEEMDDLEVAIWIQNPTTKEIYNSQFAYEYCEHVYPIQNLEAKITGDVPTLNIKWDAPAENKAIGYNVIVDGKTVAENITDLVFIDEDQSLDVYNDMLHIAEVVAVYENGMTSLNSVCIINDDENINELDERQYIIYPNPTKDHVNIIGENIETIDVYNIHGQRVKVSTSQQLIDVAGLKNGIYFIKIKTDKGDIVRKFIKN